MDESSLSHTKWNWKHAVKGGNDKPLTKQHGNRLICRLGGYAKGGRQRQEAQAACFSLVRNVTP